MSQPIDLYCRPTPNGWKVLIAFEEIGLSYQTHLINIGAGDHLPPISRKSPPTTECVPSWTMTDRTARPCLFFESVANLQYLAEKARRFSGSTAREKKIAVTAWQMGGVCPLASQTHHFLTYNTSYGPAK